MKHRNVYQAVEYLYADQGLSPLLAYTFTLPSRFDTGKPIDWSRVNAFLGRLTQEDRETFCIGDQDDQHRIRDRHGKDGEYAHLALDHLFELIGA